MININNKRWDLINSTDIKSILAGSDDETFFFEFKSDDEDPSKLVKEISALANTYGGYVFLGINDDKSIGGCKKWTEQRIHTTIHDSLTPTPNFDVRKFTIEEKTILVIKVEEGTMPPYITGKGAIYERLSSGSYPIKDSARLTQLYNKRADQEARVKAKIEFGKIDNVIDLPRNLCGYIDIGFSVTCSEPTFLHKNFYTIDLTSISKDIIGSNSFSISRIGNTLMFTVGQMAQSGEDGTEVVAPVGLHDYLVVYDDCSASCRILLYSDKDDNCADVSVVLIVLGYFQKIYELLCGEEFYNIFVHAQKFESLTVLRQFVPVNDFKRHFKDMSGDLFQSILRNHREKYGENLVIQSNRVPSYGYDLIDKQWFNKRQIDYSQTKLIEELFMSNYVFMGYIDPVKINKEDDSPT